MVMANLDSHDKNIGVEMKKTVLILLADGFEEIEAVSCIDVLRRAGLDVVTASIGRDVIVCGSHSIKIQADMKFSQYKSLPEALVLPGGSRGAKNLAESIEAANLIKECHKNNKIIAAICASPAVVLLKSGILAGKKVTCFPDFKSDFDDKAVYLDEKVVADENIITSQGPGTALYFALRIVEELLGKEKRDAVQRDMVFV